MTETVLNDPILWLIGMQVVISGLTLVIILYLMLRFGELHLLLNSRLTELLRIASAEAALRGRNQERTEEREYQETLRNRDK